ncbi:hypothetical protein [Actinoplanes sp. NPDC051851]|uniref:hypothetical protein n=1 Tax=Actinoplanes sp. NPDC051851 TaxID=3154753 RepID=UPI00343B7DA8
MRFNVVTYLVPALLLGALAACGGNAEAGGASPTASAMSDADLLTLGKQIVQCMRDNGIPDMPDPYVDSGHLKLDESAQEAMEAKYTDEQVETAKAACQDLWDTLPQGAVEDDEGDAQVKEVGPADVPALTRFAQCLRENGYPEWPDPNAEGKFPISKEQAETMKPAKEVVEKCRQYWDGPVGIAR